MHFIRLPQAPPPEDRYSQVSTSKPAASRPWFPSQDSSFVGGSSYQSGGIPSFGASVTSGAGPSNVEAQQNQWETRFGLRVDILAAFAYLLGPISGQPVIPM